MKDTRLPSHKSGLGRRAVSSAIIVSLFAASVAVPPPVPTSAAIAAKAKAKKQKPPKFDDDCKPLRQPFTRIKNYQTGQILKGALIGAVTGVLIGAIESSGNRRKKKGNNMLEYGIAGAVSGGLVGYLSSIEQVRENQAELQVALGKFDDERAQYSTLPQALVDLGNCRNVQVFTVQQQFDAQLLNAKTAAKRLDKIESWVAEDDRIIANAAKSDKASILTYAQANAVADGMSAQEAKDKGDLIFANYDPGADAMEGSVELSEDTTTAESVRTALGAAPLGIPGDPPAAIAQAAQAPAPAAVSRNVFISSRSGANVRAIPSVNGTILGSVAFGTSLTATDKGASGWTGVLFEQKEGFVSSGLLTDSDPATVQSPARSSAVPPPPPRRAPRPDVAPIKMVYKSASTGQPVSKVTRSIGDGRAFQAVNTQRKASFTQANATARSRLAASVGSART